MLVSKDLHEALGGTITMHGIYSREHNHRWRQICRFQSRFKKMMIWVGKYLDASLLRMFQYSSKEGSSTESESAESAEDFDIEPEDDDD